MTLFVFKHSFYSANFGSFMDHILSCPFQFILQAPDVVVPDTPPILLDPLIATIRIERYTFIRDLHIWDYPMSHDTVASVVIMTFEILLPHIFGLLLKIFGFLPPIFNILENIFGFLPQSFVSCNKPLISSHKSLAFLHELFVPLSVVSIYYDLCYFFGK